MAKNLSNLPCKKCGKPIRADKHDVAVTCATCLGTRAIEDGPSPLGDSVAYVVKEHCATYDRQENTCLQSARPCPATAGGRCTWFEHAVIGAARSTLAKLQPKASKMLANALDAYEAWHMHNTKGTIRLCDCGAVLMPRRRMCDQCRDKARKATKRAAKTRKS